MTTRGTPSSDGWFSASHAISPDDRHIVLQQLFRHATKGIVKDDAASSAPLEVIAKQMGGK